MRRFGTTLVVLRSTRDENHNWFHASFEGMKPKNWYDFSKSTLEVSSKESKNSRQIVILRKGKEKKERRREGKTT
jgi:hypothetical protein